MYEPGSLGLAWKGIPKPSVTSTTWTDQPCWCCKSRTFVNRRCKWPFSGTSKGWSSILLNCVLTPLPWEVVPSTAWHQNHPRPTLWHRTPHPHDLNPTRKLDQKVCQQQQVTRKETYTSLTSHLEMPTLLPGGRDLLCSVKPARLPSGAASMINDHWNTSHKLKFWNMFQIPKELLFHSLSCRTLENCPCSYVCTLHNAHNAFLSTSFVCFVCWFYIFAKSKFCIPFIHLCVGDLPSFNLIL